VQAGADHIDRTFRFSDFRQPQKLLLELGGPMLPAILGTMGLPLSTNQISATSLGLNWEAHNDTLRIGAAKLRVYRLRAKLLDRYDVKLYVSPGRRNSTRRIAESSRIGERRIDRTAIVAMIELIHIVKRFGDVLAVNDLSLTVNRGEFFVVLGPNAAGKTTTIKILTGLIKPTAGTARVAGFDVQAQPLEVKRRMAYVPDFPFLYDKLTPWEFFRFIGQLFGWRCRESSRSRAN
jgi:ABC-type multidrug transport system fused ATPase/permease subunit